MSLRSLAPGLLLAAPALTDPNFHHSVILLARHDEEGALGWRLNGRVLVSVGDLVRDMKLVRESVRVPDSASFDRPARVGGPVNPTSGWLMYRRTAGAAVDHELVVASDLAVTGDASVFERVMQGELIDDFHLLLGYAGWGPAQLENEIAQGAWLPVPCDTDIVLNTPPDQLWEVAYRQLVGSTPGAFTSMRRGSA